MSGAQDFIAIPYERERVSKCLHEIRAIEQRLVEISKTLVFDDSARVAVREFVPLLRRLGQCVGKSTPEEWADICDVPPEVLDQMASDVWRGQKLIVMRVIKMTHAFCLAVAGTLENDGLDHRAVRFDQLPILHSSQMEQFGWSRLPASADVAVRDLIRSLSEVLVIAAQANEHPSASELITIKQRELLTAFLQTAITLLKAPLVERRFMRRLGDWLLLIGKRAAEKQVETALGAVAASAATKIAQFISEFLK
jgi:hypothetical protein